MFEYICPKCGNEWVRAEGNAKQCPFCTYWNPIVSYTEDGNTINQVEYKTVSRNARLRNTYTLRCPECQTTADFFCNDIPGLTCHCGGFMQSARINYSHDIKALRKRKNLSQAQLSKLLRISRSQLSMIEIGKRDLSPKAHLKLKTLTNEI